MPTFEPWDIIRVPFPYTDRPVREHRPALVVATNGLQDQHGLLWVVMITSAENRGWAEDVLIGDLDGTGLGAASVVRTAKIATIEAKEAEFKGRLPSNERLAVSHHVLRFMSGMADEQ